MQKGRKIMSFNQDSTEKEVNQHLRDNYERDLSFYEYSLRNISSFYKGVELKKRKSQLQKKINELQSKKRLIIKKIYDFLTRAELWNEINENLSNRTLDSTQDKEEYIIDNFNLDNLFDIIDSKKSPYRRKINLLNGFILKTADKKKRIKPHTLIVLVWLFAFQFGRTTKTQKFEDVRKLLEWFLENRNELIVELFGELKEVDEETVKSDYERYIQNPNARQKIYNDLARDLYNESFSDVED